MHQENEAIMKSAEEKEKKYELTSETINFDGATLYRIRALKRIGQVEAGQKGGWIEHERNLAQTGRCWVGDEAKVYGDAFVSGDASVYGTATVCHGAQVSGCAKVFGDARVAWLSSVTEFASVYDGAAIDGRAIVKGDARVTARAGIEGGAIVGGNAWMSGEARISGSALVHEQATVFGYAQVSGHAVIFGKAEIYGDAVVEGNAQIFADASVHGQTKVCGEARIDGSKDIVWLSGVGSDRKQTITVFRGNSGVLVTHDFFAGSLEKWVKIIEKEKPNQNTDNEYSLLLPFIRQRMNQSIEKHKTTE